MKRIEDMTIGEIKALKESIADELRTYLKGISEIVSKSYAVGIIGFSVDTDIHRIPLENFETLEAGANYNIGIHFSKEEDYENN